MGGYTQNITNQDLVSTIGTPGGAIQAALGNQRKGEERKGRVGIPTEINWFRGLQDDALVMGDSTTDTHILAV